MMRSEVPNFSSLPFWAAAVYTVLFFASNSNKAVLVSAQPIQHQDAGIVDRCIGLTGEECVAKSNDFLEIKNTLHIREEEDERDPMLQKMPGYDVDAYVRADISSFYQEAPGSRQEFKPKYNGQAGKFVNMSPEPVTLYWDPANGQPPVFHDTIGPWSSGGTACYPTHKFIFTKPNKPKDVLCRFTVTPGISVYYYDPYTLNEPENDAMGKYTAETRSLDELKGQDREYYDAHVFNLEFGRQYKNFTGGSEWLTMYPRNPPRHKMWRADYFGQEHHITTNETYFLREPPAELLRRLSVEEMRDSSYIDQYRLSEYRAPGLMNVTIKSISCAPRAFEIKNFLSEVEIDHILKVVAKKNNLVRSTTGGHESSTRTSRTTWVPRHSDPILNAIYRRVANVLRIDEALLRKRFMGERDDFPETKSTINEEMQIVHYAAGQQYTPHHDFSYPKAGQVDSPTRSINLCMYLKDVVKGGRTSFPRWRNGETSQGLEIEPEKGKAVIFYMINPDGNLDDLTHHAGMPVLAGEKWFSNLWIHDPYKK